MLGRRPVNSLVAADLTPDAAFALQELRHVSRLVQQLGWHWNTERSVELQRDVNNRVPLGDDVCSVDNAKRAGWRTLGVDLTMRPIAGVMYLWDKNAQAQGRDPFDFSNHDTVRVDLVRLLDFESTPDSFRHYVMVSAGRRVQTRIVTDPALHRFSQEDELAARTVLAKQELDTADANALNRTWIGRRQSPIDRLETL